MTTDTPTWARERLTQVIFDSDSADDAADAVLAVLPELLIHERVVDAVARTLNKHEQPLDSAAQVAAVRERIAADVASIAPDHWDDDGYACFRVKDVMDIINGEGQQVPRTTWGQP